MNPHVVARRREEGWTPKIEEPLRDRFFASVAIEDVRECWIWVGPTTGNGYGMLRHRDVTGAIRLVLAHRLSVELFCGPIPDGFDVCHRCDHPWCVNPLHLFVGTAKENIQDSVQKGRHSSVHRRLAAARKTA